MLFASVGVITLNDFLLHNTLPVRYDYHVCSFERVHYLAHRSYETVSYGVPVHIILKIVKLFAENAYRNLKYCIASKMFSYILLFKLF